MTVFFKALFSALLEHLTKLLRTDKTGADADATPKELQESFQQMVRRKRDEFLRDAGNSGSDGMRND